MYYLERLLVDQINYLLQSKKTIRHFINTNLETLINDIKSRGEKEFSIDYAFFPLFSVIPINDDIHKINTRSGYIDNKIAKTNQLSREIPQIIKDSRDQFNSTIEINRNLALSKVNPPTTQKNDYIENINNFKKMIEEDLLGQNFSTYLLVLTQTREALNEFRKIGLRKWRLKFDPKYRFFINKKQYGKAKDETFNKIEKYFEQRVQERVSEYEQQMEKNQNSSVG